MDSDTDYRYSKERTEDRLMTFYPKVDIHTD